MAGLQTYAFDNARQVQEQRLRALEAALDAGTIRHLEAAGVGPGWRCLEVGAGGGSIAAWLSDRVGATGHVTATDLDTTVLRAVARPNLEVRAHDVLADDFPPAAFDLVHLRLVLAWLRDPAAALGRLRGWLKPGGVLVAEELDFVTVVPAAVPDPDAAAVYERVVAAHLDALEHVSGFDRAFGRRLPAALAAAGFSAVGSEGRASIWSGGGPGMVVWRLTFEQLREPMLAAGTAAADVDRAIALCDDPRVQFVSPLVMAAWGHTA